LIRKVEPPLLSPTKKELAKLEDSFRRIAAEKPHQAAMALAKLQRRSLLIRERKRTSRPFVRWAFGELGEDSRWPSVKRHRSQALLEIAEAETAGEIPIRARRWRSAASPAAAGNGRSAFGPGRSTNTDVQPPHGA
jgi:hypothetical protein